MPDVRLPDPRLPDPRLPDPGLPNVGFGGAWEPARNGFSGPLASDQSSWPTLGRKQTATATATEANNRTG